MPKILTRIFAPHSPVQRELMYFLANPNPLPHTLWFAAGTKTGKTLGAAGGLCYAAPRKRGQIYRVVAPIYKQIRMSWRYCSQILPGKPWVEKLKSDYIMLFPKIQTEIQFWHGQSPEDLEGEGVNGQINDECSKLKAGVLSSSRTTRTLTRGKEVNISTPRGRNHFWKGCMRAKEEMNRAKREGRTPREIFLTAPTSANPFVPKESIEEARRLLPLRLFQQYYEAMFIADSQVIPELIIDRETWKAPFIQTGAVESWIHPDHANLVGVAGADWAKKNDYTVCSVLDHTKRPFKQIGFLRFHQKRYTEAVGEVVRFLRRFKEIETLYHDKTGVGEAVDDILYCVPGLVYNGVIFSNASKASMVNDYITGLERQEVIFADWAPQTHEHQIYEVETNNLGQMRYSHPEGEHDDIVTADFLAYTAACEHSEDEFEIQFVEDLPGKKFATTPLENHILESLDIDPEEGF